MSVEKKLLSIPLFSSHSLQLAFDLREYEKSLPFFVFCLMHSAAPPIIFSYFKQTC